VSTVVTGPTRTADVSQDRSDAVVPGAAVLPGDRLATPAGVVQDADDSSSAAAVSWDQACDTCFATDGWSGSAAGQDLTSAGVVESPMAAMDIAAVAAGIAFAFNGFGKGREERADPKVARRLPR
jgi:hypothetical protein